MIFYIYVQDIVQRLKTFVIKRFNRCHANCFEPSKGSKDEKILSSCAHFTQLPSNVAHQSLVKSSPAKTHIRAYTVKFLSIQRVEEKKFKQKIINPNHCVA